MSADPTPKLGPLNRGMNAAIGALVIMALFAVAGPLLGVAVAFGVAGLIARRSSWFRARILAGGADRCRFCGSGLSLAG